MGLFCMCAELFPALNAILVQGSSLLLHGGYIRDVMAGNTLSAAAAGDCSAFSDFYFIHTFSSPGVQAGKR
ncbi:hypothetical protein D3C73_1245770 [compost metagenome]